VSWQHRNVVLPCLSTNLFVRTASAPTRGSWTRCSTSSAATRARWARAGASSSRATGPGGPTWPSRLPPLKGCLTWGRGQGRGGPRPPLVPPSPLAPSPRLAPLAPPVLPPPWRPWRRHRLLLALQLAVPRRPRRL